MANYEIVYNPREKLWFVIKRTKTDVFYLTIDNVWVYELLDIYYHSSSKAAVALAYNLTIDN